MKHLIFSIIILSTFACQKHEVDCDNYRAKCTYIQFSFSDCTPNGGENGWAWDNVTSDTTEFDVWGCPEQIEQNFYRGINQGANTESLKKFNETYPSTCDCE